MHWADTSSVRSSRSSRLLCTAVEGTEESEQPRGVSPSVAKRRKYTKRVGVKMWESQLRKGSLALAVLATLRNGRLYGSEIRDRLERIAGLTVTEGVIYPILRRLGKTECLEIEWVDPAVGQCRRCFALTSRGHQYLAELSNTWTEFAGAMDRMLACEREDSANRHFSSQKFRGPLNLGRGSRKGKSHEAMTIDRVEVYSRGDGDPDVA